MRSARAHFAAQGRQANVIKLYGSMELAPLVGLADCIVDLVTLKDADRILVVDGGQVVAYDTQEALLRQDGLYAHLYRQQERGDTQ